VSKSQSLDGSFEQYLSASTQRTPGAQSALLVQLGGDVSGS
jgi:hypothetical protein